MTSPRGSRGFSDCHGLPWCTTDHTHPRHPDDDDHRSDGLAVYLTSRSSTGEETTRMVELGLLQRQSDAEPWLVIDDGGDIHSEVTLASARRIVGVLREDDAMRRALGL